MLPIEGQRVSHPDVTMTRAEVLFEFGEAATFTTTDDTNRLYLAHWIDGDESEGIDRYLVVPTSKQIVESLKSGTCSLREALGQPWSWMIDLDRATLNKISTKEVSLESVPPELLPELGTTLQATDDALLAIEFSGQGSVLPKLSSVKQAIASVQSALRKLALANFEAAPSAGRPPDKLRSLYDWPVTKMAIASLHIEFGLPAQIDIDSDSDVELLRNSGVLLAQGVNWASDKGDLPEDPKQRENLMAALMELAPSPRSEFTNVVVHGRYFAPITLHSGIRDKVVKAQAKPIVSESILLVSGLVRELDRDHWTFIIRDAEGTDERLCEAGADFDATDELVEAFYEEIPVIALCVSIPAAPRLEVSELVGAERRIGKVPALRIESSKVDIKHGGQQ